MRLSAFRIYAAIGLFALSSCGSSPSEQADLSDHPTASEAAASDAAAAAADADGAQAPAAPGDNDTPAAIH